MCHIYLIDIEFITKLYIYLWQKGQYVAYLRLNYVQYIFLISVNIKKQFAKKLGLALNIYLKKCINFLLK